MDHAALTARHTAAITRYARQLDDEGRVPQGLLDELAAIAGEHAAGTAAERPLAAPYSGEQDTGRESPAPAPANATAARAGTAKRTRTRTR